ncbi:hypothetical protein ACWGID_36585 [Kribbella sp. NPDC054772]
MVTVDVPEYVIGGDNDAGQRNSPPSATKRPPWITVRSHVVKVASAFESMRELDGEDFGYRRTTNS